MAKPNYQFEKRQRELEKKRKKEEKAQRKAQAASGERAHDDDANGSVEVDQDEASGEAEGGDTGEKHDTTPD